MRTCIVFIAALCVLVCFITGCQSVEMYNYRWMLIRAANLDNTGRDAVPVVPGATVPAAVFALRLRFTAQFMHPNGGDAFPSSPGGYASFMNLDTVSTFTITRLDAAGAGGSATDVTDDFLVREIQQSASLDQFHAPQRFFGSDLVHYQYSDSLDFILMKDTEPQDSVRFAVTLVLSGERTLTDTTDYVTLR